MNSYDIPILFIVFRRLDTTKRVFEVIRRQRPKILFVAADGPHRDNPQELKECVAVRDYIMENVDWHCELHTLFREENWGVKRSPPDAISWFFSVNERGIILEDDCLPNDSFFIFMKEMLERYSDKKNVMSISGYAPGGLPLENIKSSYYFSYLPHIWGWGTWSRAWAYYDGAMNSYLEFKNGKKIKDIFPDDYSRSIWTIMLDAASQPSFNGWDFQWVFTLFNNNGLSINPSVNMVENIGFDSRASHPFSREMFMDADLQNMNFPLVHPNRIISNVEIDFYENHHLPYFRKSKFFLYKLGLYPIAEKIFRKLRHL